MNQEPEYEEPEYGDGGSVHNPFMFLKWAADGATNFIPVDESSIWEAFDTVERNAPV